MPDSLSVGSYSAPIPVPTTQENSEAISASESVLDTSTLSGLHIRKVSAICLNPIMALCGGLADVQSGKDYLTANIQRPNNKSYDC